MQRIVLSLLLLIVIATLFTACTGNKNVGNSQIFFVSPSGSKLKLGTMTQPFSSLEEARRAVKNNNSNMTKDIVVFLLPGKYYLNSPVMFDETDSGTNGFNVIYKTYGTPGSAILVGGNVVSGWEKVDGNIYKAKVPPGSNFSTLYEGEKRAIKARYPNYEFDSFYPLSKFPYLYARGETDSHEKIIYGDGELTPEEWEQSDMEVVHWEGPGWDWFTGVNPVEYIDPATRSIYLKNRTRYKVYGDYWGIDTRGCRYFLQNSLSFIDRPGEFYLDNTAALLYYYPYSLNINEKSIVAPTTKNIITIKGRDSLNQVHNLVFDGLSLQMTDFTNSYRYGIITDGETGDINRKYPIYDFQVEQVEHRQGMIYLEYTNHIAIKNCHLSNSGYSGIFLYEHNSDNYIYGNLIEHMGHSGVYLHGPYPGEGNSLTRNIISNNLIHDVGELIGHASGIYLFNSSSNEVSYSEIYNSPRYGVMFGTWPGIPNEDIYAFNNTFKYLNIHNTSQDSGDTSALYAFGISKEKPYLANLLDQIMIYSVYSHPSMRNIPPDGIFLDNDTYGQQLSNILIKDVQSQQFRLNSSGDHILYNVSWMPNFDDMLIEKNIMGLKSDFVYGKTANKYIPPKI